MKKMTTVSVIGILISISVFLVGSISYAQDQVRPKGALGTSLPKRPAINKLCEQVCCDPSKQPCRLNPNPGPVITPNPALIDIFFNKPEFKAIQNKARQLYNKSKTASPAEKEQIEKRANELLKQLKQMEH